MLQVILIVFAVAIIVALMFTRKFKSLRAKVMRAVSMGASLCFIGSGLALTPAPLTANDGVQRANFIGTDMAATEELNAVELKAFPDGNYILTEETDEGQFIYFMLESDGQVRRVPSEEVVFTTPELYDYETPVIRYGRSYLDSKNWGITFMGQRWDFVHYIVAPEYFGRWVG